MDASTKAGMRARPCIQRTTTHRAITKSGSGGWRSCLQRHGFVTPRNCRPARPVDTHGAEARAEGRRRAWRCLRAAGRATGQWKRRPKYKAGDRVRTKNSTRQGTRDCRVMRAASSESSMRSMEASSFPTRTRTGKAKSRNGSIRFSSRAVKSGARGPIRRYRVVDRRVGKLSRARRQVASPCHRAS